MTTEDLYKNSFDGYRQDPPPGVWKGVNRRLATKSFFTPGLGHFNILYVAAAAAIIVGACWSSADITQRRYHHHCGFVHRRTPAQRLAAILQRECTLQHIHNAPKNRPRAQSDYTATGSGKRTDFRRHQDRHGSSRNILRT